jgi:hypothetical protein
VCPGILIFAHLQGQDITPLKTAIHQCNIPLDTISEDHILMTLAGLPSYCEEHHLAYGKAHVLKESEWKEIQFGELLG